MKLRNHRAVNIGRYTMDDSLPPLPLNSTSPVLGGQNRAFDAPIFGSTGVSILRRPNCRLAAAVGPDVCPVTVYVRITVPRALRTRSRPNTDTNPGTSDRVRGTLLYTLVLILVVYTSSLHSHCLESAGNIRIFKAHLPVKSAPIQGSCP